MEWTGWRRMWVMVMFDLPVITKEERKAATVFRKRLLNDGFLMMQYSVYMRPCLSEEQAQVHDRRVKKCLPPQGEVRVLHITDKQFERMKIFAGKKRKESPIKCEQTTLF